MFPYINHKSLQLSVSGQFSVLTSMFSLVGGTVTVRGRGLALGTLSEGEVAGGGRGRGRPVMPLGRGWMAAAGREVVAAAAGVVMMYVVDDEPGETVAHRQTDEHGQRDGWTSPGTLPHTDRQTDNRHTVRGNGREHDILNHI